MKVYREYPIIPEGLGHTVVYLDLKGWWGLEYIPYSLNILREKIFADFKIS